MSRLPALVLALLLWVPAACRAADAAPVAPAATPPAPAPLPRERPLQVGFLVVDGVYGSELVAPYDVFHHTTFHAAPAMHVFTVAPERTTVTTFEGLRLLPDYGLDAHPPIDVLVVPSAEHSMDTDLANERLIAWVASVGARARFVVSFCDGAFVLARAGLLDGRRATTFPDDVVRLRAAFPGLEVLAGPSFVHDGKALTSVGGAKSYEAALYLCELLYGKEAADGIAHGLLIDWDLGAVPHAAVAPR